MPGTVILGSAVGDDLKKWYKLQVYGSHKTRNLTHTHELLTVQRKRVNHNKLISVKEAVSRNYRNCIIQS